MEGMLALVPLCSTWVFAGGANGDTIKPALSLNRPVPSPRYVPGSDGSALPPFS